MSRNLGGAKGGVLAIAGISLGMIHAATFEFLPIGVAELIMSVFALVRSQ
jgi:hypothetical protein